MLHTLSQTSLQFPQIKRFDEHFTLDILKDGTQACSLVAINMMKGTLTQIRVDAAIVTMGSAGHIYRYNTNGAIITDDGMWKRDYLVVQVRLVGTLLPLGRHQMVHSVMSAC